MIKKYIPLEGNKKKNYIELKTLGEIMQHKGEPLLFGYWDIDFPAYGWVAKVVNVKSPCSEISDDDPDAVVDGLSIESSSDEFVKLYNGSAYESRGKKYNKTCAYKDTYGDKFFDGQLFCRTLTPSEMKIYKRANKMEISFDPKPIEVYICSETDEITDKIW